MCWLIKCCVNICGRSLKKDLELVRSGQVDSQIKEMWEKLQALVLHSFIVTKKQVVLLVNLDIVTNQGEFFYVGIKVFK